MADEKKIPVSPVNGQPVPDGSEYRFKQGDEQRERARRAGRKSGAIRKARKTLREELLSLLSGKITSKNGEKMKTQEAISTALIQQALRGNVKAFTIIRDTIGEKPIERIMLAEIDQTVIDEVESAVYSDGENDNDTE